MNSFADAVAKTLKKGGILKLVGFGTYSVSKRAARTGRHPKTHAVIKIKVKKVVRLKARSALSSKVK